jgi:cellulose biosynthesis protein BcsQ
VLKGTDVEGRDLLPADFSYRHLDLVLDKAKKPLRGVGRVLASLEDGYDLAILDCAPSISLVPENVFDAADLLLVPLVPSTLSVRTLEQPAGLPVRPARAGAGGVSRSSRWSTGASACTARSSLPTRRGRRHG